MSKESNDRISELLAKNAQLQAEIDAWHTYYFTLTCEIDKLKEEIENRKKTELQLTQELKNHSSDKIQLQVQISELSKELDESKRQNCQSASEYHKIFSENVILSEKVQDLEKKLLTSQVEQQDYIKQSHECLILQEKVSFLKNELKLTVGSAETERNTFLVKQRELDEEKDKLLISIKDLENQILHHTIKPSVSDVSTQVNFNSEDDSDEEVKLHYKSDSVVNTKNASVDTDTSIKTVHDMAKTDETFDNLEDVLHKFDIFIEKIDKDSKLSNLKSVSTTSTEVKTNIPCKDKEKEKISVFHLGDSSKSKFDEKHKRKPKSQKQHVVLDKKVVQTNFLTDIKLKYLLKINKGKEKVLEELPMKVYTGESSKSGTSKVSINTTNSSKKRSSKTNQKYYKKQASTGQIFRKKHLHNSVRSDSSFFGKTDIHLSHIKKNLMHNFDEEEGKKFIQKWVPKPVFQWVPKTANKSGSKVQWIPKVS